jgi:hypothetical protein
MTGRDGPLPPSPMKGEVKGVSAVAECSTTGTSPLVGEDGRGPSRPE